MVKFPKEVSSIIKNLQLEKFEAYTVGACVRDSICGFKPLDWDIITDAKPEDLFRIYPDAQVLDKELGVIRLTYVSEDADETEGEGIVCDVASYKKTVYDEKGNATAVLADTIEEDLASRDFSVNAIADSGMKVVDPYDGKGDINKKLIRPVGNAEKIFSLHPEEMLQVLAIVSELGFDPTKAVMDAIFKNINLLKSLDIPALRDGFMDIMGGKHTGKGLNLLLETGIINFIVGDELMSHMTHREKSDLLKLVDGVDKTKPVAERRLGLFFTVFKKGKALRAIERLQFDDLTNQHLVDACYDLPQLYFASGKESIKQFVYYHGFERYNYLTNLEKAQRLAFDLDTALKIEGRMFYFNEIKRMGEPIFPEDLAITPNELIEAGICTREDADKMMTMLVEHLHFKPNLNRTEELLKLARKYKKNKLAAAVRAIPWLS